MIIKRFKMEVLQQRKISVLLSVFFFLSGVQCQSRYSDRRTNSQFSMDPNPIQFPSEKDAASSFNNYGYAPQSAITEEQPSYAANPVYIDGTTTFSLNMFKDLSARQQGNIVVSPLSMATLLGLLQQGANGRSAQQLESVLGLNKQSSRETFKRMVESLSKRDKAKNEISFANAVFVNRNLNLDPAFKRVAIQFFKANVDGVDFRNPNTAVAQINKWVSKNTNGRIPTILNADAIDPNLDCILTNAVYFKGTWLDTFDSSRTVNLPFQPSPGVEVRASFMHQTGDYLSGENKKMGARWIEVPFQGNKFTMILILPIAQHELEGLIQSMTPENLKIIMTTGVENKVVMSIPKFNIQYDTTLVNTLMNMGITEIFGQRSGLHGITAGDRPLQVGKAFQRAGMSIDEVGSTAAAVSVLAVNTLSLANVFREFHFTANQPFVALIVDKENTVPIFMAKISDPSKAF